MLRVFVSKRKSFTEGLLKKSYKDLTFEEDFYSLFFEADIESFFFLLRNCNRGGRDAVFLKEHIFNRTARQIKA
jgi:hypothetical protein